MYGVLIGKAMVPIEKGGLISIKNLEHASSSFNLGERKLAWQTPDVSKFRQKPFMGYHRSNGSVGTANYWLVIPMVFCENRNVEALKDAITNSLGYDKGSYYRHFVNNLVAKIEAQFKLHLIRNHFAVKEFLSRRFLTFIWAPGTV